VDSAQSFLRTKVLPSVALLLVVAAGLVTIPGSASAEIPCDDKVSDGFLGIGGGSDFYDDPKASDRYDDIRRPDSAGREVPSAHEDPGTRRDR
jgi:hypothetical protein